MDDRAVLAVAGGEAAWAEGASVFMDVSLADYSSLESIETP